MAEPERPSPDALLRRVQAEERRAARAHLKVYLGYAPGVGKTFKMLSVARELVYQGVDVVVGIVEHHGRYDTHGLVLGLDILPQRSVAYRDRQLTEFDLDAALRRKPKVLILDELAHSNAPGGRHERRWQDVMELLDAGIEVHTTLNIQHLESLNDVVAQLTGVRVRETVPDAVLDRADEVEMVDLPPEELLQRLKEGKVYLGEQAQRAAEHFFRRGNLLGLRELALRRVADRVDADVQAYREEHELRSGRPTADRMLVCVGPSPGAARLIRATRRMAAGLRAPWVAAYVEVSTAGPVSPADRDRVEAHLRLAESLGADVERLSGNSTAEALLDFARAARVTRLVVGKPTHSRWRDRLRGSLVDALVRGSGDIDVHVISGDETAPVVQERVPPAPAPVRDYLQACVLMVAGTGAAWVLDRELGLPDVVMVYLAVIVLAAFRFGMGPAVLTAALSTAAYDFFFVPPVFAFSVSDSRYWLTFTMMFVAGILVSTLTTRLRRQEGAARSRERRTGSLYTLTRNLAVAREPAQAAEVLCHHAADVFDADAAVYALGSGGSLQAVAQVGTLDAATESVARWALGHAQAAGLGTDTLPGTPALCVPLPAGGGAVGVVAVRPRGGRPLDVEQRHLLEVFARQSALAFERGLLAEEARASALRVRTEEMRSSLLSAVSHDLRTPLAAITGAATTLRDRALGIDADQRADLLEAICEEAARLERLVGNLLDMTRLESGSVEVRREWVPLEELIGSALTRLEVPLAGRKIHTVLAPSVPLVSVDPVLFEQVFVNLLENVAKYTPPASPVDIEAHLDGPAVVVTLADRGPGFAPGDVERVFEKFYRGRGAGMPGAGLGLAIVDGIVRAHHGSVSAANREGGGALFTITLPVEGTPPTAEAPKEVGDGR